MARRATVVCPTIVCKSTATAKRFSGITWLLKKMWLPNLFKILANKGGQLMFVLMDHTWVSERGSEGAGGWVNDWKSAFVSLSIFIRDFFYHPFEQWNETRSTKQTCSVGNQVNALGDPSCFQQIHIYKYILLFFLRTNTHTSFLSKSWFSIK